MVAVAYNLARIGWGSRCRVSRLGRFSRYELSWGGVHSECSEGPSEPHNPPLQIVSLGTKCCFKLTKMPVPPTQ